MDKLGFQPTPLPALPHLDSRFWHVDKALVQSSANPRESVPFATMVAKAPVWMKDRFAAMRTCPDQLVAAPNAKTLFLTRVRETTTLRAHTIFVGGHVIHETREYRGLQKV
jgi:hypothetical protein